MTTAPSESAGISRRALLRGGAATGLGLVFAGSLDAVFGSAARAASGGASAGAGYGPLVADPNGLLALPRGFSYTVLAYDGTDDEHPGRQATRLVGGETSPGDPDAMASFPAAGGGSVLVLNHELSTSDGPAVPALAGLTYDPGVRGGTTNIVVDKHNRRVRQYVSLAGTDNNCAGGVTPWGTWLTCEETESRRSGSSTGRQQDHGYVFEVDPHDDEANLDPKPIKAFGRFPHEAVAVDPATGRVYETEDASNPNGLLYRWTPPSTYAPGKGALRALAPDAGVLEAMRAYDRGALVPDLSVATTPGTRYDLTWAVVPDRDAKTVSTRKQFSYGSVQGPGGVVTRARKLEGMWWADGGTYFVSSYARAESAVPHDGQVWFLDPKSDTITLTLRFAYTPDDQDGDPDGPDNITVSPHGGVILAEDNEGAQHLVGSTADGQTFFLARNDHPSQNEFAGPTFSADGGTLFVNVQSPGYTFAITGPWKAHR